MVQHIIDLEKCRGCGKCIEKCGLELWELVDAEGGKKKARVIEEAGIVCNCCGFCRDACPETAIIIIDE
jgi:ferredoxin